jgi:hypothetical protein
MKYQKGDLVRWNRNAHRAAYESENIMIIKEAFKAEIGTGLHSYYRYSYVETGREDSYLTLLYDDQTEMLG